MEYIRKMAPAHGVLKQSKSDTISPPIRLPNIGIRQNTPVIKPNGKARPGEMPNRRQITKTTIVVEAALISATVTAPDT